MMFSVAPTLGKSKLISVPTILSVVQIILPKFSCTCIPNFLNPFKCKSIGLEPISHPPGYENVACLYLPIKLPAKITEDLIFLIRFSEISNLCTLDESITTLEPSFFTLHPNSFKISIIIFVSSILGTLYNLEIPSFKIVAAIIGNEAFFDPDTKVSPSNLFPPSIIKLDINISSFQITFFYFL